MQQLYEDLGIDPGAGGTIGVDPGLHAGIHPPVADAVVGGGDYNADVYEFLEGQDGTDPNAFITTLGNKYGTVPLDPVQEDSYWTGPDPTTP